MSLFSTSTSFGILINLGMVTGAFATVYSPVLNSEGETGLTFSIPYTLGTHEGRATEVSGEIEINSALELISGEISIPVSALDSGNMKRDCHIQEALGLDYTKSGYPGIHVCDDSNRLPPAGNDSLAFPNLVFKAGPSASEHSFQMHGVATHLEVPIQATEAGVDTIRLKATFTLSLPAHGVVIMPVRGSTVGDTVTVSVDLLLRSSKKSL